MPCAANCRIPRQRSVRSDYRAQADLRRAIRSASPYLASFRVGDYPTRAGRTLPRTPFLDRERHKYGTSTRWPDGSGAGASGAQNIRWDGCHADVIVVASKQMTLAEIRSLVAAGSYNLPLPRQVDGKRLILSLTRSKCCGARELLVRSRNGGFVSRDCLKCGAKANLVRLAQIPDLDCPGCLRFNRDRTVEPILQNQNYWYRCVGCGREWEMADIVPDWIEAFEYSGLAAPGDAAFSR